MRTALVCVRTPVAAQSIAACAARLGVATLRAAVSETEALAQLGERPAELILADTAVTRPDTVGFTRRVLALAPRAVLVLFGIEDPRVAEAAVAAGARGLIRCGDSEAVPTVTKALLLIGSRATPAEPAGGTHEHPVRATTGPAGPGTRVGERTGGGPPARPGGAGAPAGGSPGAGSPGMGSPGVAGPGVAGPGAGSPGPARTGAAGAGAGGAGAGGAGAGGGVGGPGAGGAGLVVPVQRGDPPGAAGQPEGRPIRPAALTERELQVLRGMADGKSNAEIGRDLYVSEDTVKTHARRLFRKLKARDRAHAVAVGFRTGALG